MARLFTCGFEENSIVTSATMWNLTGAGAGVGSTAAEMHSGLYYLTFTGTAGKAIQRNLQTSLTSGTVFVRWYWSVSAAGVADQSIFRNISSGAINGVKVEKLTAGTIRLTNTPTAETTTSTLVVSANTWYRFELGHVISDTNGEVVLRIYVGDSTSITETLRIGTVDTDGKDTLPTNVRDFSWEGISSNTALTYKIDDIAINDALGGVHDSWPGPGKIALLTPNGDTAVAWTKAGTPELTNYGGVDDVPGAPNDATDYNQITINGDDKLALSDLPSEVTSDATMKVFDVYGRVSASASSGTMNLKVWDENGTATAGPTFSVTSTTWRMNTVDEHHPYNLAGKTKANVDSFSAGYGSLSGAVEKRISALWVNVEWTEATGLSAAQIAPAFQFPGAMIGRRYV